MNVTYQIGIDLGGTKTEVILLAPDSSVVFRKRLPTPHFEQPLVRYSAILETICALVREGMNQLPDSRDCSIGVGIPGTLDRRTGLVQNANLTCLRGKPFQKDLETILGRPIGMDNDANCFTLAEARMGAVRGYGLVFGMILGTGCGGGICINGKIHQGRHDIAGEWGHFSVDPRGEPCYCGNTGCLETKISGNGMATSFYKSCDRRLDLEQITTGYRAGDPHCIRAFEQFLEDFGRCVGGLISLLDPDAIVIGGGVSKITELYTLGVEKIRRYAYHDHIRTPILKNKLGDSAGVFGAAWIGRRRPGQRQDRP
jgi:fructokinase